MEPTAGGKTTVEFPVWYAFRPLRDDNPAEIDLGYLLRSAVWANGYATEGSRALLGKGFTELDVERVMAPTMTVNSASRRVMGKPKLRYVRTFFREWPDIIQGSEHGDREYEPRKEEWAAPRG
jgi:RimJ/RimL family protein N-acetyltransferase